jgi:hypothetical protein
MSTSRRRSLVAVAMGLLAAASVASRAEDAGKAANPVAGTWTCVQNLPGGQTRAFEMRLSVEGDAVVGSVSVTEGEAYVRGKLVADGFKLEVDGENGTYEVNGKVAGDAISGTWSLGTAQGTWEGKRKSTS